MNPEQHRFMLPPRRTVNSVDDVSLVWTRRDHIRLFYPVPVCIQSVAREHANTTAPSDADIVQYITGTLPMCVAPLSICEADRGPEVRHPMLKSGNLGSWQDIHRYNPCDYRQMLWLNQSRSVQSQFCSTTFIAFPTRPAKRHTQWRRLFFSSACYRSLMWETWRGEYCVSRIGLSTPPKLDQRKHHVQQIVRASLSAWSFEYRFLFLFLQGTRSSFAHSSWCLSSLTNRSTGTMLETKHDINSIANVS